MKHFHHRSRDVTIEELAKFLRLVSHRACSTNKAKLILDLVASDEDFEKDFQSARDIIVRSIARDIQFKRQELERIEEEMREIRKLFDCQLETMPGISTVTAFSLIALIGEVERFRDANKLARYAGIAPVRYSSAGKGKDQQSKQGNRVLYSVLYFLAVAQVQISPKGVIRNPSFRAYFEKKTAEGKTKIQAIICIMRRLINVIYQMMKRKTAYTLPEVKEIA